MNRSDVVRPRPFLLEGARGNLHAIYYPIDSGVEVRGDLLYVPPFAEEMNRCRAMVAMQARALAAIGVGTLVLDPYGTGDSSGEFADVTWEMCKDDLTRGIEWLRRNGNGCLGLWGIRLGAIMAAELAAREAVSRLLLWQPVLNGKTFFTQFLRIRIAAEIEQAEGIKSTDVLRHALEAGESIEVSGYRIGPALGTALDRLTLPGPLQLKPIAASWFEVLASADTPQSRANTKAADDYRAAGVQMTLESVVGPPFWQVHERELAPELISATTRTVSGWSPIPAQSVESTTPNAGPVNSVEAPVLFSCNDDLLAGVVHRGAPGARRGVVVVVAGGPQYRAGAHRQFVSLARKLARRGYPVVRFDLRGMGDSSGTYLGFQRSDPDIRAAIDTLLLQGPGLEEVVLLGECESASGILFYAWRDPRVKGAVLINPWVRTEEGQAQVIVKHYYLDRLRSPELWKKIREGRFKPFESLGSLLKVLALYWRGRRTLARSSVGANLPDDLSNLPLPVRTAEGLRRFSGQVMILMSGRDYIAREFDEITAASKAWAGLLDDARVTRHDVKDADHTFSREVWKNDASDRITEWIGSW